MGEIINVILLKRLLFIPLIFILTAFGYSQQVSNVINAGISGNNTDDLLKRITKDCISKKPDLTILMIGTNDMNSVKHIPIKSFTSNLEMIIDSLLTSKSKVILMNILPAYEPYLLTRHPASFYEPEGYKLRLNEINKAIEKVAAKKKVSFLDINRIFTAVGNIGLDQNSYLKNEVNSNSKDGIHPTTDGYRAIAIAVYQYIVSNRLPHKNIVCFGDSITAGGGDKNSYPFYLNNILNIKNTF